MSVNLDLSSAQMSKLRNGHSIQIKPSQMGCGSCSIQLHPHAQKKMYKSYNSGKGMRLGGGDIAGGSLLSNAKKYGKKALENKQVQKLKDRALDKGLDYAVSKSGLDPSIGNFVKKQARREIDNQINDFVGGSLAEEYQAYKLNQGSGMFNKKNLRKGLKTGVKGLKVGNQISKSLGYDSLTDMAIDGVVDNTLGRVDPTGGIASDLLKKQLQRETDKQMDKHGGSFVKQGGSFRKQGSGLQTKKPIRSKIDPDGAWISDVRKFL